MDSPADRAADCATREALTQAIATWTAAVYPGETMCLEAAEFDPAPEHPHTWYATARLSNGVHLRFTLVLENDGTAWVTRYARLSSGTLTSTQAVAQALEAPG
jgi:hypothetical protein